MNKETKDFLTKLSQLNPYAGEIGEGMLHYIVDTANKLLGPPMPQSIRRIVDAAAFARSVNPDDILSKKRTGPVAEARMIAMYLAHDQHFYMDIAMAFDRCPATVFHAVRTIEERYDFDKRTKTLVDNTKNQLSKI